LFCLPAVLFLRERVPTYLLVFLGSLLGSISIGLLIGIDANFTGTDWAWPQMLRALALPMITFPLGLLLLKLPSQQDLPGLTSLYGLCKAIGGVIGVSCLTVYTEHRQAHHLNSLSTPHLPNQETEAWLAAFNDTFLLVACAMLFMTLYFGYLAFSEKK
jgi:hypothetical protein